MSRTGRSRRKALLKQSWCLRPSVLGGAVALALAWGGALAQPGDSPAQTQEAQGEVLFVTVVRNGLPLPDQLLEVDVRTSPDGQSETWVRSEEIAQAGVLLDDPSTASAWLHLDGVMGVKHTLDPANQALVLEVDVERLNVARQRLEEERVSYDLSPTVRGLVLDYDLAAQGISDSQQASAWAHARTLGGVGQLSQTFRVTSGRTTGKSWNDSVRLDTQWTWQDPQRMLFATAGDSISGSLEWSRSVRFAGLQFGRDFSLQPYRITTPQLTLSSSAALPSTVEVLLDGAQSDRREVTPGRFDLEVPIPTTGVGHARVVVTDAQGFAREVDVPLYGTSRLLGKGLTDGSLEVGYLRRDYGLQSNAYDDQPFASITARRGVSNALTLETHAEWRDGMGVWGVGATTLVPRQWGVLHASASQRFGTPSAAWSSEGQWQRTWGWHRQGERISLGVASTRRDPGFADVVSVAENSPLALATDQAWAAFSSDWGHWGVGYTRQTLPVFRNWDGREQRVASGTWSGRWREASTTFSIQHGFSPSCSCASRCAQTFLRPSPSSWDRPTTTANL